MRIENVSKNEQFKVNLSRKANAFTLIEMRDIKIVTFRALQNSNKSACFLVLQRYDQSVVVQ